MTRKPTSPPDGYAKSVDLRDGRRILIRPVGYADRDSIASMHRRLSLETLRLRFHFAKRELTQEDLESLCNLDYNDNFALAAEMQRNGTPDIVGIGRYFRLPKSATAEIAFVVEDTEQGNGIGTALLRQLGIVAQEKGIGHFVAELTGMNRVMLEIYRSYSPTMKVVRYNDELQVTFPTLKEPF
jgi:RimJ/RimL family protein N-acetyltransferase